MSTGNNNRRGLITVPKRGSGKCHRNFLFVLSGHKKGTEATHLSSAHLAHRAASAPFDLLLATIELCEFSGRLRTSSRTGHDSETVTLSQPVMPIADGLVS